MKKHLFNILFFYLIFVAVPVFSTESTPSQIQGQPQVWNGTSKIEEYKESSFRRGEVLFFLSIPFIFLSNFLIVGGHYYLATFDNSFKIPKEPLIFMGITSLALVSGLIYIDLSSAPVVLATHSDPIINFKISYEYLSKLSFKMVF